MIRKVLHKLGYDLIQLPKNDKKHIQKRLSSFQNLGYDFEKEAFEKIKQVNKNTMLPYQRLVTLFQQTKFVEENNIEGCFVECGVWKGGAMGLMALTNLEFGKQRRNLHLFDSFEEICAPSENDGDYIRNEIEKKGFSTNGELIPLTGIYDSIGGPGSIEINKNLLEEIIGYDSEYITYHKGWFQNTIPADREKIDKIAILRIDGDWYESTKVCLKNLYDKVTSGGFVIIDDYNAYNGCKKAVDEFLLENNINPYMHHIDPISRYWIKEN